jgi:hypothetical protein
MATAAGAEAHCSGWGNLATAPEGTKEVERP